LLYEIDDYGAAKAYRAHFRRRAPIGPISRKFIGQSRLLRIHGDLFTGIFKRRGGSERLERNRSISVRS
jgi:hypothetical protein